MPDILNAVLPFIVIGIVLVMVVIWNRNFDYQCGSCGSIFSLPPLVSLLSPHWMMKKLVVCPYCGERTWAARIPRRN